MDFEAFAPSEIDLQSEQNTYILDNNSDAGSELQPQNLMHQ